MNKVQFNEALQKVNGIRAEVVRRGQDPLLKAQIAKLDESLGKKDAECRLTVAVCGQYSAGKSTLIHALTGDKTIAIGQNVTTSAVKTYPWGDNCLLADTPGICAGHEEHDALSKEFMAKADLLVYMVTIQGFDRVVEPDFRRLILEQYPDKSMLLMNKRNEEPGENEPNWRKDAEQVVGVDMLKQLRFTIIDAEDYLIGTEENEPSLVAKSHFDDFVEQLNAFVKDKGLLGRVVSRIDEMNQMIVPMHEDFVRAPEKDEFTRRQKQALATAIAGCDKAVFDAGVRIRQKIKEMKYRLVGLLTDETMNEFKTANDKAQLELEEILADSRLGPEIESVCTDLQESYSDIVADAALYEESIRSAAQKLPNFDKFGTIDLSMFKTGVAEVGKLLGGVTKDAVVQVAHFFGHSFKPWGATKLCNGLKAAGPWLSVLGNAVDVASMLMDKKHQAELESARQDLASGFDEIEQQVVTQLETMKKVDGSIFVALRSAYEDMIQREREQQEQLAHKHELALWLEDVKDRLALIRRELVAD